MDRYGNQVPDAWSVTALDAFVTVAGDTAIGAAIGRGRLEIRSIASGTADTSWVSVVPNGVLSAFGPLGWVLFHPDGTIIERHPTPVGGSGFSSDWSPDGAELVFDGNAAPIRIVRLDDSVRRLTNWTGVIELYPKYSPDGQWVSYSHGDARGFSIHRVRPDGADDEVIVALSGKDVAPALAPNGRILAYTVFGADELRSYDLVTKTSTLLAPTGHTAAWAPDGGRLAYWSGGDIMTMAPDGSDVVNLTQGKRHELGIAWSPDGRWIVARSHTGVIDLIDTVTHTVLPLAFTQGWAAPTWKP